MQHDQHRSEGIGWAGGEEWESKLHVCTAPENAIPGLRDPSNLRAVRVNRTVALLTFPKPCSGPPHQVSKPSPSSAVKIQ